MYHGLTERSGRFFFLSSSFSLRRLFKPSAAAGCRLARFRFDSNAKRRPRDRDGRLLGGERGKFQAGLHSRTHHADGNAIFADDQDETTCAVSTVHTCTYTRRCRLNVAPTAARKISGFAIFVSPAFWQHLCAESTHENIVTSYRMQYLLDLFKKNIIQINLTGKRFNFMSR